MQTKFRFFQQDTGYIVATNVCPKGFENVLFVCWQGKKPEDAQEVVLTADKIVGPEVAIADMPHDWLVAVGCPVPKPPKEPKTVKVRKYDHPLMVERVVVNDLVKRPAQRYEIVIMVIASGLALWLMLSFK